MGVYEIIEAMEKTLLNIQWYFNRDYSDAVKLREIEYRLGIIYGYGKVLESIHSESFWKFHEKNIDTIKEYEDFCRKTVRKYREDIYQ